MNTNGRTNRQHERRSANNTAEYNNRSNQIQNLHHTDHVEIRQRRAYSPVH